MKKLLLTVGLAALTLASAHERARAQGTINPLNGTLTRIKYDSDKNGVWDPTDANITSADGIRFGLFWGPAGSSAESLTLAGEMTIGSTSGVMVGLPAIFSRPDWGEVGTTISLQIRAISHGWIGQTDVKQIVLAPAAGPGTVIWGTTANASRFSPLLVADIGCVECVPEPSTLALGGLACGFLLLRARKNFVRR